VRKTGAAVSLISDGDVAGVIHCADPKTGIDIYLGIGGAPEGVLAASALRCTGGQMQTRLIIDTEELRERTLKMGIKDPKKKYHIEDMVRGDCLFAATGVTSGPMLSGVKFGKDVIETETVVMRFRHGYGTTGPGRTPSVRKISSRLIRRAAPGYPCPAMRGEYFKHLLSRYSRRASN
jgi:fructose-1,6-bisphosphatase II / sedoheptulose-1,7-bisphosphatase